LRDVARGLHHDSSDGKLGGSCFVPAAWARRSAAEGAVSTLAWRVRLGIATCSYGARAASAVGSWSSRGRAVVRGQAVAWTSRVDALADVAKRFVLGSAAIMERMLTGIHALAERLGAWLTPPSPAQSAPEPMLERTPSRVIKAVAVAPAPGRQRARAKRAAPSEPSKKTPKAQTGVRKRKRCVVLMEPHAIPPASIPTAASETKDEPVKRSIAPSIRVEGVPAAVSSATSHRRRKSLPVRVERVGVVDATGVLGTARVNDEGPSALFGHFFVQYIFAYVLAGCRRHQKLFGELLGQIIGATYRATIWICQKGVCVVGAARARAAGLLARNLHRLPPVVLRKNHHRLVPKESNADLHPHEASAGDSKIFKKRRRAKRAPAVDKTAATPVKKRMSANGRPRENASGDRGRQPARMKSAKAKKRPAAKKTKDQKKMITKATSRSTKKPGRRAA
jgi:hypothetical protein